MTFLVWLVCRIDCLFYNNRDNARRTRKRKKLYVTFLNNAIEALEVALKADAAATLTIAEEGEEEEDMDVGVGHEGGVNGAGDAEQLARRQRR